MTALKAILVLGIISCSYAYSEKDLCQVLPDKATFRHSTSCSKYYTCVDGKPIEGTCLAGLFFDKEISKCNDQKKVKCDVDLNSKCTSNSIYLADPESCEHYYICMNGKAKRISCPMGTNFDPESSGCTQKDEYVCQLKRDYNICKVTAKNVLFKNEEDCHKYNVCSGDKIVSRSCPGSLWYNSKDGKCDLEENSQCGELEPVEEKIRPETSDICGTATRPYIGLVHDGVSCRGYFECAEKHDALGRKIRDEEPRLLKCKNTEIFNEKTKKCAPRTETKCRFDRCDGWDNQYVNIENDGCRGYAMCEGNKEIMRMKCPDNYYFDENNQDCVTAVVNYPSCSKV